MLGRRNLEAITASWARKGRETPWICMDSGYFYNYYSTFNKMLTWTVIYNQRPSPDSTHSIHITTKWIPWPLMCLSSPLNISISQYYCCWCGQLAQWVCPKTGVIQPRVISLCASQTQTHPSSYWGLNDDIHIRGSSWWTQPVAIVFF